MRTEYISSALDSSTEEAAVTIKQCEASRVTPALIELCHGRDSCEVRAEPVSLGAPRCDKLHVALKITFTCMDQVGSLTGTLELYSVFQDNFLPHFTARSPGDQVNLSTVTVAREDSSSSRSLPEERVRSDTDWFLQLLYNLIHQTSQMISFMKVMRAVECLMTVLTVLSQAERWKLVLVVTLSIGLGVSCLLILLILQLSSLYRKEIPPPSPHPNPQPVDLDSDLVDYDINSQLYTPLPEPKIMKISPEVGGPTSSLLTDMIFPLRNLHPFNFQH